MTQITIVRHGQANSAAKSEADYDRLSELGWEQARWLGSHMEDSGEAYARVYSGTLRRHRETAEAMNAARHAEIVEDPRLNEIEYYTLSELAQEQLGLPVPETSADFARHMPETFEAWREGRITGAPESFENFETRIASIMAEIATESSRALIVSSGGVIAMVIRQVLSLDTNGLAKMVLAGMNTSVHRFLVRDGQTALTQYNAVPHLETPTRQYAKTHF